MKRLAFLAVVIGFALSTRPAGAQEPTGAQLLEECELAARSNNSALTSFELQKATHCEGYLQGAIDVLGLWQVINDKRKSSSLTCLPDGVTIREAAKVVVKYLNDHPNKLHEKYFHLVC